MNDQEQNKQKLCKCGRSLHKPHCVICGGTRIYRFVKKKVSKIIDTKQGITKDFAVFRCDVCGVFDEYQLLYECKAPELISSHDRIERRRDELWNGCVLNAGKIYADQTIEREYKRLFGCTIRDDRIILASAYYHKDYKNGLLYLADHPEIKEKLTRNNFWDQSLISEEDVTKKIQEEKKKEQELKQKEAEELKQKELHYKQNTGIKRFGRSKWKFTDGTMPPMSMIPQKGEIQKYGNNNSTKPNDSVGGSNADSASRLNSNMVDTADTADTVEVLKTEVIRVKKSPTVFEGKLSDEDLRNLPGVMEIVE